MKGFHLVVLLAAGPGIRDTQVAFFFYLICCFLLHSLFHQDIILNNNNYTSFFFFQCGFKMFTRAAARRLFTNVHLKRYV